MALIFAMRAAPVETLVCLFTLLTGKRVRAWNELCRISQNHPRYYQYWSHYVALLGKREFIGELQQLTALAVWPLAQGDAGTLNVILAQLEREGREWVVFHTADDHLDSELAAVLGAAVRRFPEATMFYWDEEWNFVDGTRVPWIKPDWSERLLMARDFVTGASAFRIADARAALAGSKNVKADPAGLILLALSLQRWGRQPRHLPLVLTRRRMLAVELSDWLNFARQIWPSWRFALREDDIPFLQVAPADPPSWPGVTVIIPTKDRVDLLSTCLSGLEGTDYPGFIEIIVVDNGSSEPATLTFFAEKEAAGRIRLLRDNDSFNFSRLNNRAAAAASGEFLCLLNNDVEVLEPDWLANMVRHAVQPGVGAVGAQLLYPDGTIQHAGVAIGLGNAAGHIQRGVNPRSLEHAAWHAVTREVTAVTAACLLVAKADFEAVGGLDEAGFAVAFNDVDFCLKLDALGLTNVYCAEARLIHAESRSRPHDYRPDQIARFERELALLQSRWQTQTFIDPLFSPLFARSAEKCLVGVA